MNIPKNVLSGILCAALTFWAGTATASTLIDANFDNLDEGPVPVAVAVAGVFPVDRPTTGGYFGTNSLMVTDSGDGNSLVINKVSGASNSLDLRFHLRAADAVVSNQVVISFDFMISDTVTPTGNFFISIRNSDVKNVSGLLLATNGSLSLNSYVAGSSGATSSTGTSQAVATLAPGVNYNISMLLDFATGISSVTVNGGAAVTGVFAASSYGIIGVDFSVASAAAGNWTLDNVAMQAIPEPASMALLGFGSIAFTLLAKRRSRL